MKKPNYIKFGFELPEYILSDVLFIALSRGLPYQKVIELATCEYIIKNKENQEKIAEKCIPLKK